MTQRDAAPARHLRQQLQRYGALVAPQRSWPSAMLVLTAVVILSGFAIATATAAEARHPGRHRRARHQQRQHRRARRAPHPQSYSVRYRTPTVSVVFGGRGGGADPGDDYPPALKLRPQDAVVDQWREYNRECTSFAAWALASRNGFTMPFNANARDWGAFARARGLRVDSTPGPGSIAWSTAGYWGHVAYVQDVLGSSIHIEEYNHDGRGNYSSRIVPASAFTGYIHFHDRADNPPPPPEPTDGAAIGPSPLANDLEFIKTTSTPGTVEIHWAAGGSGFQQRGGDYPSDFSSGDASNGDWQAFGMANGAPELGFVKLRNTSGAVEVHWDVLSGTSYKRAADYTSDFSPADAGNGTWQLFGSANGAPILGFIKVRNTPGTVEVHWDVLSGTSYKRAGDYTSDFSPADAVNGTWQLFGSANGAPILGFIKVRNTAGTVEAHWDVLSGNSYRRAGDYTSDFSPADGDNGVWHFFGSANGAPQLGLIKLRNTPGTVEPHWDTLNGSSYKRAGDSTSDFSSGDSPNGAWQIGPF